MSIIGLDVFFSFEFCCFIIVLVGLLDFGEGVLIVFLLSKVYQDVLQNLLVSYFFWFDKVVFLFYFMFGFVGFCEGFLRSFLLYLLVQKFLLVVLEIRWKFDLEVGYFGGGI